MKTTILYKNPVAKAVYKSRLRSFALDAKIKIYMLEDGEDAEGFITALDTFFVTVAVASEASGVPEDDPRLRVLRGALSAVRGMIGCMWAKRNAVAIEMGLNKALELVDSAVDTVKLGEVMEIVQ